MFLSTETVVAGLNLALFLLQLLSVANSMFPTIALMMLLESNATFDPALNNWQPIAGAEFKHD